MRSIEIFVKISRFLFVCYIVNSVSLVSTGSAERICPDNIRSPLKWTLHDDLCVLSGPDHLSWENASSFCRSISSDLLIFDDKILAENFNVSDPISRKTFLAHFNGTAGNDTWIGLHSVNKKLWWEYDVPARVMREPLSSVYSWSAGQPDRSYGLCGVIQAIYLPNGTSNYTLKLSLSSCESQKSFVCFRKSIDLTVPPTMLNVTSLCPKDWLGNVDSAFCYQSSATKSFDDALSSCRTMGGTLMYPKSELEYYFVKAVFPRGVSQDNYWVGLYINDTTVDVDVESWKNWTYLQHRKQSVFMDGCVYLRKANDSFQLWTLNCTNDGNTVAQFCQIRSNPAANTRPNVTADNYIIISRNFSNTSLSLTCYVEEDFYHPTKPVVWVKDGIYLDNGIPPSGLTLMLNESLSQQLDVYNFRFLPIILQGTYHCEVWGVARDRMKLNQTLLTFEDVGTFRGNMATSANWSKSLPPIAAETFWLPNQTSGPNDTLTGVFESYNIRIQFDGIQCTVLDRTCSDVNISFTLYYLYDISAEWLDKLRNYISNSSSTLPPAFKGVAWQWFFNEKIFQYLNNRIQNVNAVNEQVTLRRTDGCAMETIKHNDSIVLHFQSATFNQLMGSAEVCMIGDVDHSPHNPPGDHDHPPPTPSGSVAAGTCLGNFLDGGSWHLTGLNRSCMTPREPYTKALWEYTRTLLSPNIVPNVTRNVKDLTKGNLYAFDITSVAIILNNIAMVPSLPQDVAKNFLEIVENVLGVGKDSVLREAHTMPGNAPFRITNALEMLASNIQLNSSTNFTFQSNNPSFSFRVESTNSSNNSIGFGTRMSEYQPIYENHEIEEFDTAITWMNEVTAIRAYLGNIFNDGVRTTYIIYENTGLFNNLSNVQSSSPNNTVHDSHGMDSHSVVQPGPPPNTKMDSDPKDFKQSNDKIRINSKVVSGLINGFPLRGLNNDSIRIIFELKQKLGTNERCAFVNHTDPSGDSPERGWSFLGLINKTPDKEMMSLHCYSSHLTNFASILNIDLPQSLTLDIISKVGLVISIIGLAITLLSQILIRKLRQTVSQLTIFNLALSLLVVDIIVLAGIEPNPSYPAACPAVACLLHYFLLVAFSWMLIEAIVRYVKFTRHFRPDPHRFVRRLALPAWLLPAVVVAISAGLDNRHLTEPKKMCWLSPDVFHFGFLLPLGMIMLVNLTLFVLFIKLICCCRTEVRSNQSPKKILWRQTQASINTFIVVGLTWLFAFFAIDGTVGSQTAMAYLFCIFNCFQGFFIFVLICLANKDFRRVVSEWFSSEAKKKPMNEKRKPPENLINRFRKGTLDKGTTSLQQVQQITNGEYGTNSLSNDESCRTVSTSDGYSYGIGNNGYPDVVVRPDTIELNEITTSSIITGRICDVDDKSDVCTVASNDTNSTTDSADDYERRIARTNAVREEAEIERAPSIFVENTNDILRFC